ncbi:HlyD family efflux transporter periplasmic adaptor subunit [Mucilaginibacter sp. UR6-1]|uniref:efflux RND transporter periplasmic adaptor subunit n=1 Tax=Mucilaginibacter sp. UR6-1 TaxID=1435643 RepID=UPI001E64F923|nr:HlyD family efflux transporter periplasmic adaptor subunit [Mucilaginibacter sp. UR6-1]MCC8411256.1 HlyD family efflux transporter periplasmic adaptor subunit [Mucilaginibacter sp. UR6-1]
MDQLIEKEVTARKQKKSILIGVVLVLILAAAIWLVRANFKTSINRSELTTATVEVGSVENTLNASGEVLPEFEEILTSPISASIKSVVMDAGNKVRTGQSVLSLDKSAAQTEFEKINFQIQSKRNEISKLRLDLNKSFFDIRSNNDIKQLRIGSLADAVENARRLFKAGGGTREGIDQAELNLKVAQMEKKQLENEIKSKQQTMQIEIKEAEIALAIQENDLRELKRKLQLADIVATRGGVVTYVNKNIGASVHEGDALARIADLSSFKVNGSISDSYLDKLHNGMPVIVRVNDAQLKGHVQNVYPSVQNNTVNFDIQLDERNNKQLRPNMKVDVYLVTDVRGKTLRVANGAGFKGTADQDVFVLNGNKAVRKAVRLGLSNFDYVEIKYGLKTGDVVITSDMSEYKNARELTIKN